MIGKITKIELDFPEETRFVHEDYYNLATKIRIEGGNPYTVGELRILFDDLDIVRLITKKGTLIVHYEDEIIKFEFYPGFAYNTASVPGIFKPILDNDSLEMTIASLPHDGVYTGHQMTKLEIDKIFVDIIEYYHDLDDSGFSLAQLAEDIAENAIETAIEIAFGTDEAMKCWNQGAELAMKSGSMMRVERII